MVMAMFKPFMSSSVDRQDKKRKIYL